MKAIQVLGKGKLSAQHKARTRITARELPSWTRETLLSKALLNKAVQPPWGAALMRLRDFCCAGFLAQRYLKSLHRIRSYGTEILLRNGLTVSADMKSRSVSLSVLQSSEESNEAAAKECMLYTGISCFGLDSFSEINTNFDTEFARKHHQKETLHMLWHIL